MEVAKLVVMTIVPFRDLCRLVLALCFLPQHCDYLPHVPNMPQARAVGRVKPRSAAEDWFAVGFDPWSAGREPLSAEFIPTLSIKQVESTLIVSLRYFQCIDAYIREPRAPYVNR